MPCITFPAVGFCCVFCIVPAVTFKEFDMLDYCIQILSLFLVPFSQVFVDSVFGAVFMISLVFFPVMLFIRIWRTL